MKRFYLCICSSKHSPRIFIFLSEGLSHLGSGAAHKHLVIVLPGSPVTSECTERPTHGDAPQPTGGAANTPTAVASPRSDSQSVPPAA